MRHILKIAGVVVLGLFSTAAHASLTGTSVTGALKFGTSSTNFLTPPMALSLPDF